MKNYCLIAHPHTPELRISSLNSQIKYLENGTIQFSYELRGRLAELKIPANLPAQAKDGLWQHTCFEAFVQAQGASAYYEFNFSPSSEWAAYVFTTYRERDFTWRASAMPSIQTDYLNDSQMILTATVPAVLLPANAPHKAWQIGLTAVIENKQGKKSYWALNHVATNPDFHQAASFSATL